MPEVFAVWDGTQPSDVVALFRTSHRLRRFDVPVRCPFSPSRTPHVLARRRVAKASDFAWNVTLAPDLYEMEAAGLPRASLQARPGTRSRSATVGHHRRWDPARGAPRGPRRHRDPRSLPRRPRRALQLVTRTRGRRHLTAGRLIQTSGLPRGSVERLLGLRRERAMVLAVQPLDEPGRAFRRIHPGGALLPRGVGAARRRRRGGHLARAGVDALGCRGPGLRSAPGLAVGVGETVFVGAEGVPAGDVIESTILMARRAGGSRTVAAVSHLADPQLGGAIARWGERLKVVPHKQLPQPAGLRPGRARPGPGRVHQHHPAPQTGKVLGRRYRLGEELGRGGFGRVVEARDLDTGRDLAVKILLAEYAEDPNPCAALLHRGPHHLVAHPREHRAGARLGQAHSGELFLAMERLDGEELRRILEVDGHVPAPRTMSIAVDVLGSLAEAHEAGIVHRDIKPANIFLCADTLVKVIDFGIAWSPEDAEADMKTSDGEEGGARAGHAPLHEPGAAGGRPPRRPQRHLRRGG